MKRIINFPIIVIISILLSSFNGYADNKKSIKGQVEQTVQRIAENIDSLNTSTIILDQTPQKSSDYYQYKRYELAQDNMVAIYGIIFVFGFPALTVLVVTFFILFFLYKKRTARYHTINKAIENGIELPESFYNETTLPAQKSRLQSSLTWIGFGLGLTCFVGIFDCFEHGIALGIIPLLVGIAKLITYFVEDRKKADNNAE